MDSEVARQPTKPTRRFRRILTDVRTTFKAGGVKGVFKHYGWKIVAGVFFYYLIRDITLYLIIPWMIAKHFIAE